MKINQKVDAITLALTPFNILEDSRCPIDVQCIQAGTVRIRVKIDSGTSTSNVDITLNKPVTTETEQITLIAVRPEKESKKQIGDKDYSFVFRVVKK